MGRYYAQLDPDAFRVPEADGLAEWFETRLLRPAREDHFNAVAELSGKVVGAVAAIIEGPLDSAARQIERDLSRHRLTITMLGVRTAYWRQGIGKRLLEAAEAWARSRGASVVLLDTYVHSPVSVPFYEQGMRYTRQSLVFRKRLR